MANTSKPATSAFEQNLYKAPYVGWLADIWARKLRGVQKGYNASIDDNNQRGTAILKGIVKGESVGARSVGSGASTIGKPIASGVKAVGGPAVHWLKAKPNQEREIAKRNREFFSKGGTEKAVGGISGIVDAARSAARRAQQKDRMAPGQQTLNEQLLDAAKRGDLFTYEDIYRSAAATGARNEAIANQHIADVRGWGGSAINDISRAGSRNAAQNSRLQGQMGKGFARMLGTTGLKGSALSKLGGINSAEFATNANTDNQWFARQAANQSKLNDFYAQALRRQANDQAFMAQQSAAATAADAKQRDIQSLVNLGQLEAQQNSPQAAIDPAEVKDRYLNNLQAVGPDRTQKAYELTRGELGSDNAARSQLDTINSFYETHPVYRRQLLNKLFPSAG